MLHNNMFPCQSIETRQKFGNPADFHPRIYPDDFTKIRESAPWAFWGMERVSSLMDISAYSTVRCQGASTVLHCYYSSIKIEV